jgi:hypothetical protein
MGAENPFELSADAFDGGPGTLVPHVCVKAYPEHSQRLERMREREPASAARHIGQARADLRKRS